MKGRKSLKRQTALLIAVSLVTLFLVQALYLTWFTAMTKRRAIQYSQDSLEQVTHQLERMLADVQSIAFSISFNRPMQEYLTTVDSERKYIDLYPLLSNMLAYIQSSNNDIYDILLLDESGKLSLSQQEAHTQGVLARMRPPNEWPDSAEPYVLPAVVYGSSVYYPYLQTIYGVSGSNLMRKIGSCVVLCNGASIQSVVGGISITKDAELLLVDSADTVIASNLPGRIGNRLDSARYREVGNTGREVRLDHGERFIVQHLGFEDWTVFSVVPVRSLMADFDRVVWVGVLAGLAAAAFLLVVGVSISRGIHRSASRLVRFLRAIADGNTGQRIIPEEPMEIALIATDINRMLDRMDEMTAAMLHTQSELYEAKLRYRQTQYTALQRQINPHFLFNTLNCMATIAAVRQAPEVVTIASSMANIFRYCIKGTDIVSIEAEIACVRDYLTIIHLRYPQRIQGTVEVEEGILHCRMPKMILQPIVENAVFHGLEPKRGGGSIQVSGRLTPEGLIEFLIRDDGMGMDEETLRRLREHLACPENGVSAEAQNSIGLMNIFSRIRFLFGERAAIAIDSKEGEGLSVRLTFPA